MSMDFRTFTSTFNPAFPLSVQQIRLQEENFPVQQLHIRAKKGWLILLTRGWRIFPQTLSEQGIGAVIANMIYEPSYLSLERALRFYNLIPEGVYLYTSCTTKKTQSFDTPAEKFTYRSFSPRYYWGYSLHTVGKYAIIRIASPEKTLCDYLYFHPEMMKIEDFEEMRVNIDIWQEIASPAILQAYAARYPKRLQQQIQTFLSFIDMNHV